MRSAETVLGREQELEAITSRLSSSLGVVLVGEAGVGKSAMAGALGDADEAAGKLVVRIRATSGSSELPLGVFAGWLDTTERFLTPMFNEVRSRIREVAGARQVVLVVDDVDLLDDTSAVLVHQLVSSGEARLLATMRRGRLLPGEVIDLLQRGELATIDVGPLGPEALAALADRAAGEPLGAASHTRLHQVTAGNPLYASVLIAGARDAGAIIDGELTSLPIASPRLVDLVDHRLSGMTPDDRVALLHLAFAEPCGPGEVASVAEADRLMSLERAGLIRSELDGERLVLRLAHPLFGEVLRSATPNLQRRAALAALARDLERSGACRRSDLVKLARLAVDGGVTLAPELVARAVVVAYTAGDMVLTERLARAEFERSDSFRVGWDWANAAYTLGDLGTAREAARRLGEIACSSADRLAAAMIASQVEFWIGADRDRAVEIIDAALDRNPTDEPGVIPITRRELLANRALLYSASGLPEAALEGSLPILDGEPGPAFVRAALAGSGGEYTLGRGDAAIAILDRAVESFSAIGDAGIALSRRTVLANRALAHVVNGDLDLADTDAALVSANAISEQQISLGLLMSATVLAARGRPSEAVPVIGKAQQWWARGSAGGLARRWVLAVAAFVAGTAGEVGLASKVLAEYDADDHPSRLLDFEAELGRARMLVADRRPEEARRGLFDAIEQFRLRHHVAGELFCCHELVRLDRADVVLDRMVKLAEGTQGALLAAFRDHAIGVVEHDVAVLAGVADTFERLGWLAHAADVWAQAADESRRVGDQRAANRHAQRSAELRNRCDRRVPTTFVSVDVGPIALTRREREIGLLAANGVASREIAERLFISRRTAENHLAKVYEKLGVHSRGELAEVLAV